MLRMKLLSGKATKVFHLMKSNQSVPNKQLCIVQTATAVNSRFSSIFWNSFKQCLRKQAKWVRILVSTRTVFRKFIFNISTKFKDAVQQRHIFNIGIPYLERRSLYWDGALICLIHRACPWLKNSILLDMKAHHLHAAWQLMGNACWQKTLLISHIRYFKVIRKHSATVTSYVKHKLHVTKYII